jgi:hypothetical protein
MAIFPPSLPHAGLYFSLYGEDAVLKGFFKDRLRSNQPGTYVDIGCMGAFSGSNTALFYSLGWSGLCVDVNGIWADEFRIGRPRDAFVCAAVGDGRGTVDFYRNTKNLGMSKISEQSPGADFTGPEKVSVVRLDSLLAEHIGNKPIQFMSIDVEGAELGVLKSNDWDRWRPEVVIMECHGFTFNAPYAEPTVGFLRELGYRLNQNVGPNVLMTR